MSPAYWVAYTSMCAWIAVLFYTIILGGWLSERFKRRHPQWRHRLPGGHRAASLGAPRFRDEPLAPWRAVVVKTSQGEVEYL